MTLMPLLDFSNQEIDGLIFCSRVYKLFEEVRQSSDGISRLRVRASKLEKRLIEELLPICKYLQSSYKPGRYIKVKWIDGNQRYDAELIQDGAFINQHFYSATSYLEVTCVMHPNDYLKRELLDKHGVAFGVESIKRLPSGEIYSEPNIYIGSDFVLKYAELVLKEIRKKINKGYPLDTILVMQLSLNRCYVENEWNLLVATVRDGMPKHQFREIYLYDPVSNYSYTYTPYV